MTFDKKLTKEEQGKYILICRTIWGCVPVEVDWAMETNNYKEMEKILTKQ